MEKNCKTEYRGGFPGGASGKELARQCMKHKKEHRYIYIYIQPNHFAVHLMLIQYYKSTTLQ